MSVFKVNEKNNLERTMFLDVFSSLEASPAPIFRRCFIYVMFEVSNAKRSLKFKF